jgi:hypothetical protein
MAELKVEKTDNTTDNTEPTKRYNTGAKVHRNM